jgi:hypothetical protein
MEELFSLGRIVMQLVRQASSMGRLMVTERCFCPSRTRLPLRSPSLIICVTKQPRMIVCNRKCEVGLREFREKESSIPGLNFPWATLIRKVDTHASRGLCGQRKIRVHSRSPPSHPGNAISRIGCDLYQQPSFFFLHPPYSSPHTLSSVSFLSSSSPCLVWTLRQNSTFSLSSPKTLRFPKHQSNRKRSKGGIPNSTPSSSLPPSLPDHTSQETTTRTTFFPQSVTLGPRAPGTGQNGWVKMHLP